MADSITINAKAFNDFIKKRFTGLEKQVIEGVNGILYKNAEAIALQAKQRVPVDLGQLKNSISAPVNTNALEFTISVNAFYAPFVEFGTGRYAAQYVATLPADWQSYARQFKGQKGNEGMDKFLERIMDWVKRKGISGTYSIKTQRRTSASGVSRDFEDASVAYAIALKILRVGVKAQPFLYPSYEYMRKFITKDVDNLLKNISER